MSAEERRNREGEEKAEETGEEQRSGAIRRFLEMISQPGQVAAPRPEGARVIAPVNIDNLLRFISETSVEEEEAGAKTIAGRVRQLTITVQKMARGYIDLFLSDGTGRIYHPLYSSPVVEARLGELTQLLAKTVGDMWRGIAALFRAEKNLPPQEVEKLLRDAEQATQLAFLTVEEIYARTITIYYVNAPPELRPPLANASLGYELLKKMIGKPGENA